MKRALILFDIDGTLIGGNNLAGKRAYLSAINECCGVNATTVGDFKRSAGKNDLLIMTELLEMHGVSAESVDRSALIDKYLTALRRLLPSIPGFVLPGVRELLDDIHRRDDVVIGLATGNIEAAATEKLALHELEQYFSTGGFGSDATDRAGIVAAGIEKATAKFALSFSKVVVVGDTPSDVAAAKANNAMAIAVATGVFNKTELLDCGPELVIDSLENRSEVLRTVFGHLNGSMTSEH